MFVQDTICKNFMVDLRGLLYYTVAKVVNSNFQVQSIILSVVDVHVLVKHYSVSLETFKS